jgi:nucleoid-associated protein EbfC
MFDMMKMLGKVKEVQAKVKEAQDNLVKITDTGESGAGLVKVVANGKKQVVSIEIDPDLIKKEDKEMLQDLVVAAVNIALEKVEVKSKEELKKSTEGLIPNIPGMDLSGMF